MKYTENLTESVEYYFEKRYVIIFMHKRIKKKEVIS